MIATSRVTTWCNPLKIEGTRKCMEEINLRVIKDQGRLRNFGPKGGGNTRMKKLHNETFHNLSFSIV